MRSVYITYRFRPHTVIGPCRDRPYVFLTVIGPDPVSGYGHALLVYAEGHVQYLLMIDISRQ